MGKKIKILWFCNAIFSDQAPKSTGTWLHAMADGLVNTGEVELFNITQAKIKNTIRQDYNSICQWMVPSVSNKSIRNGLPKLSIIRYIQSIVRDINPDIIHIWGTESYWGLLTARGYLNGNVVLETQGLISAIEKHVYSGLSLRDILNCCGVKEVLLPKSSLFGKKRAFQRWGKREKEIISENHIISTQSSWVRAHIQRLNPSAKVYKTFIPLRTEFLEAEKWKLENCLKHQIFTTASTTTPYKGLHVLIDAIAILKNQYPDIKLVIAGVIKKTGIREAGYTKWLKQRVKRLGVAENIIWLEPLDAKDLVLQMHKASVVVVPSFIESYSLALDEALSVGSPTVASFSGAMPELATDGASALFFPPGDAVMCADAIVRIFSDNDLAKNLSHNAYMERKEKNSRNIAAHQLSIYRDVIDSQGLN